MKRSRIRNRKAATILVFSVLNDNKREAFKHHVWSKSYPYTAINKIQMPTNNLDMKLRVHARLGDEETMARNVGSGDTLGGSFTLLCSSSSGDDGRAMSLTFKASFVRTGTLEAMHSSLLKHWGQ
jgi:hypothetical protein